MKPVNGMTVAVGVRVMVGVSVGVCVAVGVSVGSGVLVGGITVAVSTVWVGVAVAGISICAAHPARSTRAMALSQNFRSLEGIIPSLIRGLGFLEKPKAIVLQPEKIAVPG